MRGRNIKLNGSQLVPHGAFPSLNPWTALSGSYSLLPGTPVKDATEHRTAYSVTFWNEKLP